MIQVMPVAEPGIFSSSGFNVLALILAVAATALLVIAARRCCAWVHECEAEEEPEAV